MFLITLSEVLLALKIFDFKINNILILSSISLQLASIRTMKVFNLPTPQGIHKVGYKYIKNIEDNLEFAVYYPCKNNSIHTN
jgi:hypothetical protein